MNDISPADIMTVVEEQRREITGLKLAIASLRRRLEEVQAAQAEKAENTPAALPVSNNGVADKVAAG